MPALQWFTRECPRSARVLVRAFVIALVSVSAVSNAAEEPRAELKVSVAVGPALPLGKAAERWSQLLIESGDPRLAVKLHAGASLAQRDAAREAFALKEGVADLAVGSALQWSLQLPALGVFALPWIAPDRASLEVLVANEALHVALVQRLEQQGLTLIALGALGHRELSTTSRPVRAPADLTGLRIRASPLPIVHEMFLALGALPQAIGFAQAQAALASGALDGQEGNASALASARIGAGGQRHLMLWGAVADVMVFAVRKPLWDALSPAQRDTVHRTALRAIADTDVRGREEAALRKLSQNGVAIVRITAAGHDAFRAAVKDMRARWREAIGTDIVALAEKAVADRPPAAPGGS